MPDCFDIFCFFVSCRVLLLLQLACAGIFLFGVKGSNACPAGSYVIVDEAQCKIAAETAGQGYFGSVPGSGFPRGCSLGSVVQFSTDPTGGADPNMQPLCGVGTGPRAQCL